MNRNRSLNVTLLFFVSASVLGLISATLLASSSSPLVDSFALRKPLVGSVFSLICILGISAIVVPGKCNSILGTKEAGGSFGAHSASASSYSLKGHHFDCEGYVSHTIKLGERTLCAACSGLFLGAIVAVFWSVAYFFLNQGPNQFSLVFFGIGVTLIALGFVQFKFPGLSRLLINTLFVLGAFLVLLATDALLESLFIDLYVTGLILLWIFTRILLSQWDHSRICHSCNVDCELKKG